MSFGCATNNRFGNLLEFGDENVEDIIQREKKSAKIAAKKEAEAAKKQVEMLAKQSKENAPPVAAAGAAKKEIQEENAASDAKKSDKKPAKDDSTNKRDERSNRRRDAPDQRKRDSDNPDNARDKPRRQRGARRGANRGEKSDNRVSTNDSMRTPAFDDWGEPINASENVPRNENREGERRLRGPMVFNRGGGRGRGRGGNRGGRRFDRHSGSDKTGIKPISKKEGGGAHNWGTDEDVIQDATKNIDEWKEGEWAAGENEVVKAGPNDATEAAAAAVGSEGPQKLTMSEWRRQQESGERKNVGEEAGESQSKANEAVAELGFGEYSRGAGAGGERAGRGDRRGGRGGRRARGPRGRGGMDSSDSNRYADDGSFRYNDRPRGRYKGTRIFTRGRRGDAGGIKRNENAPRIDDEDQFPTLG